MSRNPIKLIPADFTAVPALANACDAAAVDHFAADLDAVRQQPGGGAGRAPTRAGRRRGPG